MLQILDMSHQKLITKFYQAFQQKDYRTMASCYHEDATFKDPVYELQGKHIHAMWHMLLERGKEFSLVFSEVEVFDNTASANWTASYRFNLTDLKVVNPVSASFIIQDGLIITHNDNFDLYAWERQALGVPGVLMGWSPYMKNKLRSYAEKALNAFIAAHPEYQHD